MKCRIPEISWHGRDPVLSVDIQPNKKSVGNDFYRLASGGTDSHVLIWHLTITDDGTVNLDVATDLSRHQRAVNAVRFSPSGEYLASADDENVIIVWKQREDCETVNILDSTNETDKETWITYKTLRGHMQDVYDLSWSPNSLNLISGSVDNSAMIWDVHKGKPTNILSDHKGFVQGVAWDPLNQYLATLSSDRCFRVFDATTKKVVSRSSKCILPVPVSSPLHGQSVRLFHDDTLQTFFRRLTFSPDGQLIITPSGVCEIDGHPKPFNTTYIYSRYSLKQPAIVLTSPNEYTVAVKCCPLLFKLREHDENNLPKILLDYRMIFAIATKSSVYLYDTQQKIPFGVISNIHYTRLTDLTWSSDGKFLVVSSTDGFCSIIIFNENELGEIYCENDKENLIINTDTNTTTTTNINNLNENVNLLEKDKNTELKEGSKMETKEESKVELKIDDLKPKPIAIRRKPREQIIEKPSTIIRSDEKFESPEKRDCGPATPIAIRRFPITQSDTGNGGVSSGTNSPNSSKQDAIMITPPPVKRSAAKKATPIAVRRQQRIHTITPVDKTTVLDDAMDAWPIDQLPPTPIIPLNSTTVTVPITNRMEIDESRTEDLRLIYDDDDDESKKGDKKVVEENIMDVADEKETVITATTPKTPRRVEFKTISTPKSKKKLI